MRATDPRRLSSSRSGRRSFSRTREARQFAEFREEQLLDDARAELDDGRSQRADAVGELRTDVRLGLEDLQQELPEIPEL
jgi:hypothetical protein